MTHRAVLKGGGLPWPADLYLEGSDQYRGWFRSNLITAVATMGAPPYRGVLSTGWVVDQDGRAMHKSTGNYIGAVDGMNQYGADVLRLWVASVEFTADVRLGATLLANVANVYKNLRFRLRYLLSLIDDLPVEEIVPRERMEPLDRLALAAVDALAKDVVEHYRAFRLHDAYLALTKFDTEDLSAFYLDANKDRLYTSAPDAARRRSGQSAALEILRTLGVLLAPILSFTAEEAWQFVPERLRGSYESIFDVAFPQIAAVDDASLELWQTLKELRAHVSATSDRPAVESDARVRVPADRYEPLHAIGDGLREALGVSTLLGLESGSALGVETEAAHGEKCARCWKFLPLGSDADYPDACAPCAAIVRSLA